MTAPDTTTLALDRYAPEAKAWVASAQHLADERSHAEVTPLHLLARGIEGDSGVTLVLSRAGVDVTALRGGVERALAGLPRAREPAFLSGAMLDLLERAERESERDGTNALRGGKREVGVAQIVNALSQETRGPAGELLTSLGVRPGSLRAHAGALVESARAVVSSSTPGASGPLRDLVALARAGGVAPVVGREGEVRRVLTVLERLGKGNPLLVGEPGVGKSALVAAVAQRIAAGDVPRSLAGAQLLEIDVGTLLAGARLRGEIEERVRQVLHGARGLGRQGILVAQRFEQLFGTGAVGAGVGELLRSALERGEARLLATTTPEGLRRITERDPGVLRLLTTLDVDEPDLARATEIVRAAARRFELHHNVEIDEGAVQSAVRLAKRYLQDRFLPDSALDLLDEAASAKRVEIDGLPAREGEAQSRLQDLDVQLETLHGALDPTSVAARERLEGEAAALRPGVEQARAARGAKRALPEEASVSASLGEQDVAVTLAAWTGIPVAKMLEGEATKLREMEVRIGARVVGQDDAVAAVARAVRRGRVGLRDAGRPIGSFLFLGPSGVGKTELAKAVAQFLFDDEAALLRLDMSEFMERHMAQRLIGAPPGYADSEQGGFLTEGVRKRPYSVLLFDEVEKAHGDVFNLLLQVLDDGRLTDGRGRTADFSNTVVVMTSNIGSARILESDASRLDTPEGGDALRDLLQDELRRFFRPEFLNRIDDVVVFRPLSRAHLRSIVAIQVARLERLLDAHGVRISLTPGAADHLVELGYEPALGARPLRRALVRQLQDPLAEMLLTGALGQRGARPAHVEVRVGGGALELVVVPS